MDTDIVKATMLPAGTADTDAAINMPEPNPLLQSAGTFRDDPFWDEMQDSIRQHRREMDAAWDAPE